MGQPESENHDPAAHRRQRVAEARTRSPEAPSGDERSTEWAMRFRAGIGPVASFGVDVPWSEFGKQHPDVGGAKLGVKVLWLDIMDRTTGAIGSFVFAGGKVSSGLSLPFEGEV